MAKQSAPIDRRKGAKIRNFRSRLLTGTVKTVLFPLTAVYAAILWLWSVPFKLADALRRAKNPFLCADALERCLEEHDPAVSAWDLYCCFRDRGLGRGASLFNAHYVRLTERATGKKTAEAAAPEGIPQHPAGWYREGTASSRTFAAFRLRAAEWWIRVLGYLPLRLRRNFSEFGRAMESSKSAVGGAARFFRRRAGVIVPLLVGIAVGVFIAYYAALPLTLTVKVGGETIGCVESREELAEAIRETEGAVSDASGAFFKLPQTISYSLSKSLRPKYLSKKELVEALGVYTADFLREGYALDVDGTLAAARENTGNGEIALLNDTRILYQNCPVEAFLSDEELEALLLPSDAADTTGTVLELSAYRPKTLPVARSLEAGEAYSYTLSYGEEEEVRPESLSLVYGGTRKETEVEAIPYGTTYRESDTVYVGAQYLYQKGVPGEKVVTYLVQFSGETEYAREVESEETQKEPIEQIVLIGTRALPQSGESETGAKVKRVFIPPVYGEISSPFGLRDMDKDGILESGHSGIDIPAPYGTPIYAAQSGIVLEAGETGNSYGTAVRIQHENGLSTYYAHLSSVTVRVGQSVSQNQMIGTVGTTGYVTGPHVHFEVRLASGEQVDPQDYLIGK